MNIRRTQRILITNKIKIDECKDLSSKIELCKKYVRDANIEEIESEDLAEVETMFVFSEYEKLARIYKILDDYIDSKEIKVFSSIDEKANLEVNKIVEIVIDII